MTAVAALAALFLACAPAFAAKRPAAKASGLWLNSPDQAHSIEFPAGWPFPGKTQSVSPPGMTHLFFLATPDDGLAVDVAAGTEKMGADQYFEFISGIRTQSEKREPVKTATLRDKSAFKYYRSVEKQGPKTQYFTQGVLAKKARRYYVTITSPRRHPDRKEWAAITRALGSLRDSASTVGGRAVPPVSKSGAAVVNIGPDGSSLRLEKPWEVHPWGYTRRFSLPLHSFRRGPLRCEVGLLGQAKAGPRELATGLRAEYYKSAGRSPPSGESPVLHKKLDNGGEAYYYRVGLPARDDDPRKQWMLESFLSRGGQTYYFLAAAARDDLPEKEFERQSDEALELVGRMQFPK
ncbi:MAG: hypothetical protein HY553_17340 [Elusimicrobia bacterium]|nr:hypothetical protein [Elusimicrobiota bacterium]